jgi:hypothetical protein
MTQYKIMLSHLESIPREDLNIKKFNGEKGRIFEAIMESRSFRDAQSFREQCHVAHDYKDLYFQRNGNGPFFGPWVRTLGYRSYHKKLAFLRIFEITPKIRGFRG